MVKVDRFPLLYDLNIRHSYEQGKLYNPVGARSNSALISQQGG